MTNKEKKELAAKLQAEIDAKKETKERMLIDEIQARHNHRMKLQDKARSRKGDYLSGSKYKTKKPLQDYDHW